MAMDNNNERDIQNRVNSLIEAWTNTTSRGIESFVKSIQNESLTVLKEFKDAVGDSNQELEQIISQEIATRESYIKRLKELYDNEETLNQQIVNAREASNNANSEFQKKFYEEQESALESQRNFNRQEKENLESSIKNKQDEAYIVKQENEKIRLDNDETNRLKEERRRSDEEDQKRTKEQREEEHKIKEESNNKFAKASTDFLHKLTDIVTDFITQGTSRITDAYNSSAGKLAASLDQTVKDISNLQESITSNIRNNSLSSVISNVDVFNEAVSLSSAGYTNASKLQQNATDIAITREIAPNLNVDNVKNISNVLGSDFTNRFAAIQTAVQETAGSTAGLAETVNAMTSSLEPVFLNAQYSLDALQGTANISATLSYARDAGIIDQNQEAEYRNLIIELMDPSKAFSSNNTAVRMAAQNYNFDGNPMHALEAILNARRQYYGNFNMGNSYMGNISRALGARAAGDNTMSATYNPSGLYDLTLMYTNDLSSTYDTDLANLQRGDYTTQKEREQNRAENDIVTQNVANFAKSFPILYTNTSRLIITAIKGLETKLIQSIHFNRSAATGGNFTTTTGTNLPDMIEESPTVVAGAAMNAANTATTGGGSLYKKLNNSLSQNVAVKNLALMGGGVGAMNLINSFSENDTLAQKIGFGGDYLSSITSYAGIGAAVGSLIPIIGTLTGTLVGAGVGLVAAIVANTEENNRSTKALEENNRLTKDSLGEGITLLSKYESEAAVARGGGTIQLNSGTSEIAYTPGYIVGSHKEGLAYVPYDNYLANLHKGEAVVTADAAKSLRETDKDFWKSPNKQDNRDIVDSLEKQTDSLIEAITKDDKNSFMPLTTTTSKQYVIENQG